MSLRSHETVGIKDFLTIFASWKKDPDPDPYLLLMYLDPDPEGTKTKGPYLDPDPDPLRNTDIFIVLSNWRCRRIIRLRMWCRGRCPTPAPSSGTWRGSRRVLSLSCSPLWWSGAGSSATNTGQTSTGNVFCQELKGFCDPKVVFSSRLKKSNQYLYFIN